MKRESSIRSIVFSKLIFVLAIALISGVIAVIALRSNYSTMVELRESVTVADQKNGDVEKALQELRKHVHGHMNTNLASGPNAIKPPIQLKARYDRLMAAERERVKAQNAEITSQGEAICGQRFPSGGFNSARVACITDYVSANAVKENAVAEDLYKFDFVSPKWSPDLAGFSFLIVVVSAVFFVCGAAVKILKRR